MIETRSVTYIKQTRAKRDRCNICGRIRDLTWDHVPPKATLLKPNVYASTLFSQMPTSDSHMIRYQSGIKYRSICQECNGERIGRNDIEFAKFVKSVAEYLITPGPENVFTITTKVNRVLRAICGHFLAMKSSFDRKVISDKVIREYLFRNDKKLERLKIFCWFYPYSTIVNIRDVVVRGNIQSTHPTGFIGIMNSFPLAYMISTKDESRCGLDNLSQYMTKNIDEEVTVALHLQTAFHPATNLLKHYLWPVNVVDGPFGAGFLLGGAEMQGSRIGVIG